MTGVPISKETIRYIIVNYANMSQKELCAACNVSKSTVDRVAGKYHLRKSKEHNHEMGVKAGKASSIARGGKALNITPEVIRKRAESYVKTLRTEEMRYRWGLERKTKIRIKTEPRRKREQRYNLIKRGYIIDETRLIAYWTKDTKRSVRLENIPRGTWKGAFTSYYSFAEWIG